MSDKIKVLYVAHEGGIDGSNTSLRQLVTLLKATGKVSELILAPSETVADYYKKSGLNAKTTPAIYSVPFVEIKGYGMGFCGGLTNQFKGLIRAMRVKRTFTPILKSFSPDIVHLNETLLLLHARVAHNLRFPVVMHNRSAIAIGTLGIRHTLLAKAYLRYVNAIISICPSYVPRLGKAASLASVIHNPFDLHGIPTSSTVIDHGDKIHNALLIGARPEKGLYEAIQAIALAKQYKLNVIGGVREELKLRNWQAASAICDPYHKKVARWLLKHPETADRVNFLGATDGVWESISHADVVLVPWTTPHFARPLIEAWLMKKPVIASNVDGVAEYCKTGINSIVFRPGDKAAMADALIELAENPAFASEIGLAGEITARTFIGENSPQLQVLEVYKRLIFNRKADSNSQSANTFIQK